MKEYLFLLFFLCWMPLKGVSANGPLVLEDDKDFYELGLHLEIFEDKTGKLELKDIEGQFSSKFKKNTKKVPNFGFSKSAFWARFKIKNKTTVPKKWLLSFNFFLQDELSFFKKKNGIWNEFKTGDAYPFSTRKVKARPFTFEIKPGLESSYYLRVKGAPSRINLTISESNRFTQTESKNNYIFGLFFGLVLSMIVYNGFILIATKSLSNLFYILYVFLYGLCLSTYSGFSQVYLHGNIPWLNNSGLVFITSLGATFFSIFTLTYLKINNSTPKLYKSMMVSCTLGLFITISSFVFPYSISMRLCIFFGIILSSINFFAACYKVKHNYRPAKYFVLAFSFMILGVVVMSLMMTGMVPDNFFTRQASIIGSALELILLSMGLADRFNLIQEEARKLQENYAKDLEVEVLGKTKLLLEEKLRAEKSEREISGLLHNMKQAVFCIDKTFLISPPVSLFSFQIFEDNIINKSIYETLFKSLERSTETFSKIKMALPFIFSGDDLQWELMKENLPTKVNFKNNVGQEKFLKIAYSPIIMKDIVSKIMLVIEDITEVSLLERKVKEEEEKNDLKVKRLQEIVKNNKREAKVFIRDTLTILKNAREAAKEKDLDHLFRAIHTLKGNARLYHLSGLSEEIHFIETQFEKLKNNEDQVTIPKILKQINHETNEYIILIKEIFGQDVDETTLIDSDVIEIGKDKFFKTMETIKKFLSKNKSQEALLELKKLEGESIIKILNILHRTVKKMAVSLGKEINLNIDGPQLYLDLEKSTMIKDAILHLIQNSADHGIEKKGSIFIQIQEKGPDIIISISDNGKGIDPDRVLINAIEKGLINKEDAEGLNRKEKLGLIMTPGFSTKKVATEYSGRGVGLDVVKTNIQKIGGSIEVESNPGQGSVFTLTIPFS